MKDQKEGESKYQYPNLHEELICCWYPSIDHNKNEKLTACEYCVNFLITPEEQEGE